MCDLNNTPDISENSAPDECLDCLPLQPDEEDPFFEQTRMMPNLAESSPEGTNSGEPTETESSQPEEVPEEQPEQTCEFCEIAGESSDGVSTDTLPSDLPETEGFLAPSGHIAPTVVPRPVRKKRTEGSKTLHIFAVIGKYILAVLLAAAILLGGLIGYLTVTEYNPSYAETAAPGGVNITKSLDTTSIRIVSFNIGYAGLDESSDFFMDGGKDVTPKSEELIRQNITGIETILNRCDADFIFLQEVDTDSKRSYGVNQWLQFEHDLADYESRFAANYSCEYVPYPLTDTIGKVHSGLVTLSRYDITSATRYSLPCPFSWPVRVANLKRCLLVTRIALEGTEQELVLINFHLEAYDDGEGKIAQTEQLQALIQDEYAKGNYVIAGGDCNQAFPNTFDTFPLKPTSEWAPGALDAPPDGWQYAFDGIIPTCRLLNQPFNPSSSLTQFFVIDGYLVSPNVTIDRVETLDEGFRYSDHNPVLLQITLNPQTSAEEE